MTANFIYRGCAVSLDESQITIRKSDGSKHQKMCLHFIKDHDRAEQFVKDYIDLNLHDKIDTV